MERKSSSSTRRTSGISYCEPKPPRRYATIFGIASKEPQAELDA